MNIGYGSKEKNMAMERTIILADTVYDFGMLFVAYKYEWGLGMLTFILCGILMCWIVHVTQFKSYKFRAYWVAGIMQIFVAIFSIRMETMLGVTATFMTLTILIGLFAIPQLMFLPAANLTILMFYHAAHHTTMYDGGEADVARSILMYGSIYATIFIVYCFIKTQLASQHYLRATIEELREAERSKTDFLANVSHEIRTPINTICGMSEVTLREELPQKVKDSLFDIQTAGRNLQSVVSDILDFSELDSGKMEVVEEVYNITSTINDIINLAVARKSEKDIELIVDCDSNIPGGLLGDEQKLRRVIMNLMDNAIKFTNEGCITIGITARKEAYGVNLCVTIRDTGIGMKPENLEKLFASFSQVDSKRNRAAGGVGLGLAISKALVQKMGGFITLQSEYGKGSEIKFVIPQKVVDETPIVSLKNPEKLRMAIYINMEQFGYETIRDEYTNYIIHMVTQNGVSCHMSRNLAELKRRIERESFTHVFITDVEYWEDREYFDRLAETTKLIVAMDRQDDVDINNPKLHKLYKPFYVVPIVMFLNEELDHKSITEGMVRKEHFVAPEAKILVVDDSPMNIRVIQGLLKPYQVQIDTALSGFEAIDKVDTNVYDFIFMDHMMPEMDGIEALHRIRRKPGNYFKTVPIIALTANAIAGMREKFMSEGFNDFVAKPVSLSVLERVLLRTLPKEKVQRVVEFVKEESVAVKAKESEAIKEEPGFKLGDLDVESGITYCGTLESYIDILKLHAEEDEENMKLIADLFEQKDYKNYSIQVHALKSGMKSIGATKLSKLAMKLEKASKEGDYNYVLEHHGEMMMEYERIIDLLTGDERLVSVGELSEEILNLREIGEEDLNKLYKDFEDAVFTFERNKVLTSLKAFDECSYKGTSLKQHLAIVYKKADMLDYMSALDMALKLKEELTHA
ncbi:MAG: response regulator [Lachnospiraceae bacterium]|nr:response regulator [Lachnospiraceae bacterium]